MPYVALAALGAQIKIEGPEGERRVAVTDFYSPLGNGLKGNEILTEIEVPGITGPTKQRFFKFTLRNPIDFAIVSVASIITVEGGICTDARITLGAVAPGPVRARKAEEVIKGRPINEDIAVMAAHEAVAGAKPLSMKYTRLRSRKHLSRGRY